MTSPAPCRSSRRTRAATSPASSCSSTAAWRRSDGTILTSSAQDSGGASRSGPGARGPQPRPVDAPDAAHADPDEGPTVLRKRRQREMVEVVDPRVEAARVRRLQEAEFLPIEVVAELVQQRVEEAAIGRQLPEHGRAHPDPDPLLLEVVVTEELGVAA